MSVPAAMTRIYSALRAGVEASAYEFADSCFCVRRHAQYCLNALRDVGLAHVARWRRQTGEGSRGRPHIAVWSYGPGPDARRPRKMTAKQARDRRVRRLNKRFGNEISKQILRSRKDGGACTLVLDGQVAYRRGVPRGANNRAWMAEDL